MHDMPSHPGDSFDRFTNRDEPVPTATADDGVRRWIADVAVGADELLAGRVACGSRRTGAGRDRADVAGARRRRYVRYRVSGTS